MTWTLVSATKYRPGKRRSNPATISLASIDAGMERALAVRVSRATGVPWTEWSRMTGGRLLDAVARSRRVSTGDAAKTARDLRRWLSRHAS